MLRIFVVGLWCAAGSVQAGEAAVRVAVVPFSGVGVTADALNFDAEHLAQSTRAPGLQVITSREIATLIGLERQRQLMGCDSASNSCMAELAAALGAEAVLVGDIGHFDKTYQINVKVLSGSDAHVLVSRSTRVEGELAVIDALTVIGRSLGAAILTDRKLPVPAELTRAPEGARPWGWLPLGLGVVMGGVGGLLLGLASGDAAALTGPGSSLTGMQADGLRDSGKLKQGLGLGFLIASGVSLLVAAGLFAFGKDPIVLSFAPGADSFSLAFGGRF